MIIAADHAIVGDSLLDSIALEVSDAGVIERVVPKKDMAHIDEDLGPVLLIPGMVNGHSHAFQRLLRGRTQVLGSAGEEAADNFWRWRQVMYTAAAKLDPQAMYSAALQLFVEMLRAGITAVAEFHYVHHKPDGTPYAGSDEMALALAKAALDAGIRLCLLRVLYLRGGFETSLTPAQKRFSDGSLEGFRQAFGRMHEDLSALDSPLLSVGVAAHSVRAVSLEDMVGLKALAGHLPFHLHISEQPQEVMDCQKHWGMGPVQAVASKALLDSRTTLVHGTHVDAEDIALIASHGAHVCFCPGTEADLGDGLGPAQDYWRAGVNLSLGTDGQVFSSLFEEARRLEMHERLRLGARNVLCDRSRPHGALNMLQVATRGGARTIGLEAGALRPRMWADVVALDLEHPDLLGCGGLDLLAAAMFSADARVVRDVMVGGRFVVRHGEHAKAALAAQGFSALNRRLFVD